MNANDFHVGQLVSATDPATMTVLCATYTHYSTHGIIVEVDEHRVDVKWIDYIGPQRQTYSARSCAAARRHAHHRYSHTRILPPMHRPRTTNGPSIRFVAACPAQL